MVLINWSKFLEEAREINCLWMGETHGIVNNYRAYKFLIKKLLPLGFNTIALEMPEDLEEFSRKNFLKYAHYFDGRFSEDSLGFFEWLELLGRVRVVCFNVRNQDATQKQGEVQMARNLLSKIEKKQKVLVITGSFHSEVSRQQDILPMAGLVKERLEGKLVVMELKYTEGYFYNFGLRRFDRMLLHFDQKHLPFGNISVNQGRKISAKYFFHCAGARPVRLLGLTIKARLKNLYEQDQEDRKGWRWDDPIFLEKVYKRDKERRVETEWLISQKNNLDGKSYYFAAMIFQHGDSSGDYKRAHLLAKKSMDKGYSDARWLYAATFDRYLVSQGKRQRYGTQYKRNDNGRYELLPVDSRATDEQRRKLNVPTIDEMTKRIENLNKRGY